ncbi:kinetochore complex Sim4 subunit Fta4 [Metarhizium robertsii]|uniref:Uncharacterized protein n=2 Tax=Metarhizium robertsii TaxID=568076 RepID=E9FA16_METRA|nr:uncharacterized protein MAA_09115 [Metarhizium robertsii ARSEF 23]EFY95414.1 hypothetical protein MAA_09115 [Metarhizium robertsii ARSEF 23]EXU95889.1 kinetochore complex Sim4 subunit Fta4 [Metarhizium robertsii]
MVNVLRYVVYAIAVVSGVEACKRTCDIASDKNGYCYYKCTDVCDNVPASQARSKFLADLRSDGSEYKGLSYPCDVCVWSMSIGLKCLIPESKGLFHVFTTVLPYVDKAVVTQPDSLGQLRQSGRLLISYIKSGISRKLNTCCNTAARQQYDNGYCHNERVDLDRVHDVLPADRSTNDLEVRIRTQEGRRSHPIPARVLDDVLFNLNQTIQLHNRRVYPPQATYNIAEQINNSYSRYSEEQVKKWKDSESSIGRELDLAANDAIELPSSWPIESDFGKYPEKARQHETIVLRLTLLSEEQKEIRLRVEKLRRIRDAVQPLSVIDESSVQDNLVTRNGPVEEGLERIRALLARVTSRVAGLPDQPASNRPQSTTSSTVDLGRMTKSRKRNIDSFLADPRVFPP